MINALTLGEPLVEFEGILRGAPSFVGGTLPLLKPTEVDSSHAGIQRFTDGFQGLVTGQNVSYIVRCVRR